MSKDKAKLDPERGFGHITGHQTALYEQDGKLFDAEHNEVVEENPTPATDIHPEQQALVDAAAEAEAAAKQAAEDAQRAADQVAKQAGGKHGLPAALDRVRAAPGYERALAAALGRDAKASLGQPGEAVEVSMSHADFSFYEDTDNGRLLA